MKNNNINKTFRENIRKIQGNRSLSKFARDIKMNISTLKNYLDGRIPKGEKLAELSEKLGVSIDWLLKGDEKKDTDTVAESTEAYFDEKGQITPEQYSFIIEEAKKVIDRFLELKPLIDHISKEVKKLNLKPKLSSKKNKDK